ncbi:MAG TPA: BrnT family toxin [Stellaceae bacterium]|nr:BrnT family toxin [Stellaceae bacterium]
MAYEWDKRKNSENVCKHHIDFETARHIFDGPRLEKVDDRRDYGERRIIAVGAVDDVVMVVVYTERRESRRLISARKANGKERVAYQQALEKNRVGR